MCVCVCVCFSSPPPSSLSNLGLWDVVKASFTHDLFTPPPELRVRTMSVLTVCTRTMRTLSVRVRQTSAQELPSLAAASTSMGTLYVVYVCTFRTKRGTLRQYVGMTKVSGGHSVEAALAKRKVFLVKRPVAWLKCARFETLRMVAVGTPSSWEDALAEEAFESARRICRSPMIARGGPWCVPGDRSTLPVEHRRQVRAVNALLSSDGTASAKRRALRGLPGRALRAHLTGRGYVDVQQILAAARKQQPGAVHRKWYASSREAERRYDVSRKGRASQSRRNARRR